MKYVVRKGKTGAEEIEQMMVNFRSNPPKVLGGSKLKIVKDYDVNIEETFTSKIKKLRERYGLNKNP